MSIRSLGLLLGAFTCLSPPVRADLRDANFWIANHPHAGPEPSLLNKRQAQGALDTTSPSAPASTPNPLTFVPAVPATSSPGASLSASSPSAASSSVTTSTPQTPTSPFTSSSIQSTRLPASPFSSSSNTSIPGPTTTSLTAASPLGLSGLGTSSTSAFTTPQLTPSASPSIATSLGRPSNLTPSGSPTSSSSPTTANTAPSSAPTLVSLPTPVVSPSGPLSTPNAVPSSTSSPASLQTTSSINVIVPVQQTTILSGNTVVTSFYSTRVITQFVTAGGAVVPAVIYSTTNNRGSSVPVTSILPGFSPTTVATSGPPLSSTVLQTGPAASPSIARSTITRTATAANGQPSLIVETLIVLPSNAPEGGSSEQQGSGASPSPGDQPSLQTGESSKISHMGGEVVALLIGAVGCAIVLL